MDTDRTTDYHLNRWKQGIYTHRYTKNISDENTDILFNDGVHSVIDENNRVYDAMGNISYSVNSSSRIVKELKSLSGVFCVDLSNFLHANLDVFAYKQPCKQECKQAKINYNTCVNEKQKKTLSFIKTVIIPPRNDESVESDE